MHYVPSKTCEAFMLDPSPVRCIVGPIGSGKSLACIMELFRRMCEQEPDAYGVRPTRFVVVRNTSNQLRTTVVPDVLAAFPMAQHRVSTGEILFNFKMRDGTVVDSRWLLMPLERPEDQRKLLSLNITAAWIEECREIDYEVFAALRGRCSRYPSMARVAPTWKGQPIICSTNPWSESSEWHENFVLNKPESWALFRQPGGLSPDAENLQNLAQNYYQNLLEGHSDEWINTHVHGEWGEDQFGLAVFRSSFNREEHVIDNAQINPMLPLIIGMDFGRTPAAVLCQKDHYGRIIVLEEVLTFDMNIPKFLQTLLTPRLMADYANCRVFVVGDPSGEYRSVLSDETAFTILEQEGYQAIPAPSNDPEIRIAAVEREMVARRNGSPGLLIVGPKCPQLTRAMLRDYRYKKQRSGELSPTPEKNDASHVADALQYAVIGQNSPLIGKRIMRMTMPRPRRAKQFSARAWT